MFDLPYVGVGGAMDMLQDGLIPSNAVFFE
jgi:hypothetical protein